MKMIRGKSLLYSAVKNHKNIKIMTLLLCVSFTCFLTQCQACQKKDPVTDRILPGQMVYSISCGFPLPYFDVNILTGTGEEFYYAVDNPYKIAISIAINIIALSVMYVIISVLSFKRLLILNKLLLITLVLIFLFNLSLLAPYLPEFVKTIFVYAYIYPAGYIGSFFEFLNINLPDNNIPPRIYLVLLIIFLYLFSALFSYAKSLHAIRYRNK